MRKWKDLKNKKKVRHIFHSVKDFFVYKVWGSYKRGGLCGLYHWVRCHVWNRYHVINLSGFDKTDPYDWGWLDTDHKMELACWKLLCEFVEKEYPDIGKERTAEEFWPNHVWQEGERETVQQTVDRHREVRALYDWWKVERPKKMKEVDGSLDRWFKARGSRNAQKLLEEHYELEQALSTEEDEMLIRLMRVRRSLWT